MTRLFRCLALACLGLILGCGGGGGTSTAAGSTGSTGSTGGGNTASLYPDYNTQPLPADASGMARSAPQIAQGLRLGFNIGNTLEASGGQGETAWGNPKITAAFVQAVKAQGFNAIRLPVSWDAYADAGTARIDPAWMARVKEVVQYCVDADLSVVVNIHWDGGWLETHVDTASQQAVNAKQKAYWQQIATALRGFDQHVLFASANEPNVKTAEQMAVLMSYHQTFVDAVRATGGRNAWRTLIVQGPGTDIELTHTLMSAWPQDNVADRLMAEVHYYTPWNFTGMTQDESWGSPFFYWGEGNHSATDTAHNPTWGEEATVAQMFALMKARFVDRGIPVIVGEFGAMDRRATLNGDALALHEASRAAFARTVVQQALAQGLVPFWWDVGGLIDRNTQAVLDPGVLQGLIEGTR